MYSRGNTFTYFYIKSHAKAAPSPTTSANAAMIAQWGTS
jgi:hypothetical protein